MDPTITRLRFRRRGAEVEVYLDGQAAFSVDALSAARLQVGQSLNPNQCKSLREDAAKRRAWSNALSYLGRRARSRKEMDLYLKRREFSGSIRQYVLERLEENDYLDDHAFARMWIERRLRSSPRGTRALGYELKQKGIDPALIAMLLADFDEANVAWCAARARLRHWKALDDRTLRIKLSRFLAGRGFNRETIGQTCRRIVDERRGNL